MLHGAKKLLSGSVFVVAFQAINFIALARILGPTEFGIAATASAFATLALPLAGLGFGNVLLMKAARNDPDVAIIAGNALATNAGSGVLLTLVALSLAYLITAITGVSNLISIGLILATELLLLRPATVAAQLYAARSKFGYASWINVATSLVRLAAIGFALITGSANLTGWTTWLFAIALLYSAFLTYSIRREAGGLGFCLKTLKEDLQTGMSFSMGTLCKAVYTDGDKIILARYHHTNDVGLYSSAYRLSAMAFMPVRALLDAVAYKFFQEGAKSFGSALAVSWQVMKLAVPYTAAVAAVLYFGSPLVPLVLGPGYAEAANILKIIALLPLIQTIHYALADALTGANMQTIRTKAQVATAFVYIACALAFIPSYGPYGAAIVCVASEGLLAVMICSIVFFKSRPMKSSIES